MLDDDFNSYRYACRFVLTFLLIKGKWEWHGTTKVTDDFERSHLEPSDRSRTGKYVGKVPVYRVVVDAVGDIDGFLDWKPFVPNLSVNIRGFHMFKVEFVMKEDGTLKKRSKLSSSTVFIISMVLCIGLVVTGTIPLTRW